MKRFLIILATVAVLLNAGYIAKNIIDFHESENRMENIMSKGIGTKSENTISKTIYGKELVATYKVVNKHIIRTLNWK